MENGGPIEDIDLTTEDWINVQLPDMPKRYDALRRYVSRVFKLSHIDLLKICVFQIIQANAKIIALKSEYKNLESVDREKIDKLKRQYLDHKKLWETVRQIFVNENLLMWLNLKFVS